MNLSQKWWSDGQKPGVPSYSQLSYTNVNLQVYLSRTMPNFFKMTLSKF